MASYDQLAHQVEALRKENSHLRRELEDNSQHLNKLECETTGMKEVLKQLQSKLEQEAGTLASSGRSDVLHQLKELHMDLTNYYELKHQPHNLRLLPDSNISKKGAGLSLTCASSSLASAHDDDVITTHHFLDGAPPKTAVISGADGRTSDFHLDEIYKERNLLLGEMDREERERCWYFSQLDSLSQRLNQLPRIDTFSLQMDLIRQQLQCEADQLQTVMEERFGSTEQVALRTQMRVARLEQLEKELQDTRGNQETQLQLCGAEKPPAGEPENCTGASGTEATDGGSKVEMVFWLLSMLANRDKEEMSKTLLALSSSQDSCVAMRKSGCVPLLVQILHENTEGVNGTTGDTTNNTNTNTTTTGVTTATTTAMTSSNGAPTPPLPLPPPPTSTSSSSSSAPIGCSREAKSRASAALHNIIYCQTDEGQARREMRVLHMLEQVRTYTDSGWDWMETHSGVSTPGGGKITDIPESVDPLICQAMCAIMKLSFEEEYRRAMNELGGLQTVADLIHLDQEMFGCHSDPINMALRRYAGMAVTNLTFGDVVNKATLCSKKPSLKALVAQLSSDSEELHQVVSSIMRNLSWRADVSSKKVLRDIGCVSALMTCALQATKESTLKSLLSALWNLSAHSVENKLSVCSVDGALGFLVSTLTYRCQTNSLAIIESGGGILRNVSSLIATREDYRQILRDHNCLHTLLQHLRSHSLTIVSNACGTLWNLSARSPKDQELLWDLGAVAMLRNLIHSKHKMIAMGSAAALRNLLSNRPLKYKDAAVISPGSCMPSLYMRKQKALEAELDAKHLSETFDSLDKPSPKHLVTLNKPLRQIESLAKDYASDSGCFDDDEGPNLSTSLDTTGTGSFSMLSMFLSNSNFVQNNTQPQQHQALLLPSSQQQQQSRSKLTNEPERDTDLPVKIAEKRQHSSLLNPPDDMVSAAAEKLAKKITNTVAKIDRLVEDITMQTSSEDSFSLSSEDHLADWPYGLDELNEGRAKSSHSHTLSETSSGFLAHRERLSRAHALLRLKTAQTSVSTDSLNSGSTSDGYCGSKDQLRPVLKALTPTNTQQQTQRPNQLDLKVAHQEYLSGVLAQTPPSPTPQDIPERDSVDNKKKKKEDTKGEAEEEEEEGVNLEIDCTEMDKNQDTQAQTPVSACTKMSSDVSMTSIKLSPSYQQVPLIQSVAKFGVAKTSINVQAAQAMRRQAWVPTVMMTGGSITKFSPMTSTNTMETVQKYSVENTPICFSRCSSLSSLSSGEAANLDAQSENELDLESESESSSLEIIEVEDDDEEEEEEEEGVDVELKVNRAAENDDETLEDLSDSQLLMTDSKTFPSKETEPILIPKSKREKVFLRATSPAIEDRSPSSSSDNYIHETPLVMSRCSSVSSLGSFESPSIASSIQSDPCSEMIDGTISPSDLPDSPGQTMPPSRSKTPCCLDANAPEQQQGIPTNPWESSLRKFMEIADSKERFNLPPDLDSMIYFTVEKPTENFSCASSLSALPLHEHYIQKDVELKLTPLMTQNDKNNIAFLENENEEEEEEEEEEELRLGYELGERYSEGNSDDDIEILKECINSAMPSKFRKVRSSLMTTLQPHILNSQLRKQIHVPVYMMLPNGKTQLCTTRRIVIPQQQHTQGHKDCKFDDSSYTDSAEGTPVNFSSTTSLSDDTLQYPVKERGAKDCTARGIKSQDMQLDDEAKRIEDLRIFSHFHKLSTTKTNNYPPEVHSQGSNNRTTKHVVPTQRLLMQSKEVADRVASQRQRDHSPNAQKKRQIQIAQIRKLELPVIKQGADMINNGSQQKGRVYVRQMTQSSEDSNEFYFEGENENYVGVKRTSRKQLREASRNTLSRSMTNIGRIDNSSSSTTSMQQGKSRGFQRIKQSLIKDESVGCYSLSSSLSSLSDASEFDDHKNTQKAQIWYKNRHNKSLNSHAQPQHQKTKPIMSIHSQYEGQSSPSSVSMDSEDDLLQKCITSAMPKQRRKLAMRKRKAEKNALRQKQKSLSCWEMDEEEEGGEDEEIDSDDKDSDLNSVEWRAIQEGANCVVTGLQASKSQDPSSEETETESVLSFMSTSSFTPKERKFAKDKKANKPLDFAPKKPVPNLPVVFRGRTVIYTPKKETPPSQIPPPLVPRAPKQQQAQTKMSVPPKNPALAQHRSKSLHRLGRPQEMELSLPKRSSTPPPRIHKSPSSGSGSSQSSTPSKQPQKKIVTSPIQIQTNNKNIQKKNSAAGTPSNSPPLPFNSPPERKGRSTTVNLNEKSPPPKTQKSPVRIPFMQTSVRPRPLSPLVTNTTNTNRQIHLTNQPNGKKIINPQNRFELVRGSETDRNGFLRQLTFIKESKNVLRSSRNSPNGSPNNRRGNTTGGSSNNNNANSNANPKAAAVFLCSSRCQELKAAVQVQKKSQVALQKYPNQSQREVQNNQRNTSSSTSALTRAVSSERDVSARRLSRRRTSSESPCRFTQHRHTANANTTPTASQNTNPSNNTNMSSAKNRMSAENASRMSGSARVSGSRAGSRALRKQDGDNGDNFKRHASSPSINILSRVTSRSSLRSSSSDSSGKAKSEDEHKTVMTKKTKTRLNDSRITWRRIRDEDVPQILKSTLPANALPLVDSPADKCEEEVEEEEDEVLKKKSDLIKKEKQREKGTRKGDEKPDRQKEKRKVSSSTLTNVDEKEEKGEIRAEIPKSKPPKLPTILLASRKTSDATVQTDDLSVSSNNNTNNKTNSSTSPSVEKAPSEEIGKLELLRKMSGNSGSFDTDSEAEKFSKGPAKSHSNVGTGTTDTYVNNPGVVTVHFRQGSPSKSARITPFNYTPSPIADTQKGEEVSEKSAEKSES